MAKKKTEEQPQAAPQAAPQAEAPAQEPGMSKAAMIRAALQEGITKPKEAVAWIKAKYNVDVSPAAVSVEKSNQKGKDGSRDGVIAWQQSPGEPTLSDLIKVKQLLDQHKDLRDAIEVVEAAAAQVGNLERLKACIDALGRLGQ